MVALPVGKALRLSRVLGLGKMSPRIPTWSAGADGGYVGLTSFGLLLSGVGWTSARC